ncbi:DNA polymerase theta [Orchesella cincta]|uniref:DNA polymerase theta n=1 Tax=Orchesella cincta TaxID=48709 RepID=A0A1D2NL10_ORCCI|nr:DNA polymerase theta [Orchesella cincta]
MSCRRSTRLASKGNTSGKTGLDSSLVFEENEAQQIIVRGRTPKTARTPYQRNGRKRVVSGATPSSNSKPEVGRSVEPVLEVSPVVTTPNIVAQSPFQNVVSERLVEGARLRTSPTFSEHLSKNDDLSQGNDSFLLAVDDMEKHSGGQSEAVAGSSMNCSPDIFGDDAEILEALGDTSNMAATPTRTRDHSIISKRLIAPNPEPQHQPNQDFQMGNGLLNVSSSSSKGLKGAASTRKRNNSAGDIKKRKAGGPAGGNKKKKKKKGNFKLAFTNRKVIRELANSASNELAVNDLSFMTHEEKLQLSSWGLPTSVLNNYRSKGITSLFDWQLQCLENEKVLEGRNLLYSAPTSAGKTLVSEILMIKRVLELGRKAIMILPFVSVAREKVHSLQSIFGDAGVRVEGFMGSINPPGGFKAVDIAICTIEKANSLVNKYLYQQVNSLLNSIYLLLLEENALSDVGTVVVDELHLIGDPHRGYLLELLLTKLLYVTSIKNAGAENSMNMTDDASWKPKRFHIQIIGMSATLPNLNTLAKWLSAELYVTDFRPVPLKERLKVEDKMLDEQLETARTVKVESIPIQIEGDTDHIIYLALETVLNGFSVLIFCPTKALVETTAERIADQFFKIGNPYKTKYPEVGEKLRNRLNAKAIRIVLERLQRSPGGVDAVLARTVMYGVGYHHAGLTYENRDIVESSFKNGILRVIVATSTLSAGVNLPARRVMVVTPMFNGRLLDIMTYKQMCGRAGRNGIDTEGESILICPANLKEKGIALFRGEMPLVKSALLGDGSLTSSMKRALLEAVASGISSLPSDVRSYARCTFLFHSLESGLYDSEGANLSKNYCLSESVDILKLLCYLDLSSSQLHKDETIEECLTYLESQDFIRIQRYEQEGRPDEYMPTQLGSACLAASLSPDDGIIVYRELLKARECFVLENELHVIYQVTPIYVSDSLRNISWQDYLKIWENLDLSEKKVGGLIGIKECFIIKAMIGTVSWRNESQRSDMAIHQRFFAALALSDLVNEKSLEYVSNKYSLNKGILQNLQQASSTFAGMVTAFCGRLGWSNMELLLSQFQERLEFGVQRELCDLVRMDCLNGQRARILYDAGLKNVMELAAADPAQVEQILHRAAPFKSEVHGGRESSIWMLGKDVLSEPEAAQKIVNDARVFIQVWEERIKAYTDKFKDMGFISQLCGQLYIISQIICTKRTIFSNIAEISSLSSPITYYIELGQQGHIQFGFGRNDVPCPSSSVNQTFQEKKPDTPQRKDSATSADNESMEEQEQQEYGPLEGNDVPNSSAKHNNDEHKVEELFSQRQQLDDSQMDAELNILEPEDVFEDSFPEIVATNLSNLYPKQNNKDNEPKATVDKFSIQAQIELSQSINTARQCIPIKHPERQDSNDVMESNFGTTAELETNRNLQHSTPVITSKNSRFTLKTHDIASPVPNVSTDEFELNAFNDREKLENDHVDLSEAFLAEFDKDFESMEVLENSMNAHVHEVSNSVLPLVPLKKIKEKNESLRLSESDAAAMRALADDTNFESEELFPVADTVPQPSISFNLAKSNNDLDGFDEEDFILTQGPQVADKNNSEVNGMQDMEEIFEASASETETSSSWTESTLSSLQGAEQSKVFEAIVGKQKLIARVVESVNVIPSEFFAQAQFIGLGLKLIPQKKPPSTLRMGIGARVIGKKLSSTFANPNEDLWHSLAMYNGESTIWILHWKNDGGLTVRSNNEKGGSTGKAKLDALLSRLEVCNCALAMFETKDKLRNLLKQCGSEILAKLPPGERLWDPSVARWMLESDEEERNMSKHKLIEDYVSEDNNIITKLGWSKEIVEAFYVWKVMHALKNKLHSSNLWNHFTKTEMPSILPLLLMEMNGFGLDSAQLAKLKRVLQFKTALLELRAFQLAGRQFQLASPKDIKQVLFREIGLKQPKAKGTSKDVLLKLDHELPRVIVEWRKVTSALQKVVVPFQQERNLETGRVHGYYSHFTMTGRVVMSDPSLQCIPRDFDIQIEYDAEEICEIRNSCKIKFGSTKLAALFQQLDNEMEVNVLDNVNLISMRNVFIPCSSEFTLLTADYSQLELRILAHLSQDEKLVKALNQDTDVFIEIASLWKNIPKEKVTSTTRQEAKGIVYGVIYGMGVKTLAAQMEIDEREAAKFVSQFMRTYPSINTFLDKAVKCCQDNGYVVTMTGRRRYLPLINSRNPQEKAKASRQAVNTQIQGSAADLVKAAMARIHGLLTSRYPKSSTPVDWNKLAKARRSSLSVGSSSNQLDNFVYFPILNLHDELIFEVRKTHLTEIAAAIKNEMESCLKLRVKLPVVIKTGETWGTLEPYSDGYF